MISPGEDVYAEMLRAYPREAGETLPDYMERISQMAKAEPLKEFRSRLPYREAE